MILSDTDNNIFDMPYIFGNRRTEKYTKYRELIDHLVGYSNILDKHIQTQDILLNTYSKERKE